MKLHGKSQMASISKDEESKIRLLWSLFRSRKDVFARYWENSSTKESGYSPVYDLEKNPAPLSITFLQKHLAGQELLGIYPLLKDNTSYFLAIDFDDDHWFEEARKTLDVAAKNGIESYLERSKSGNGGHLWFFFEKAIPAIKSRQLGKYFLSEAHLTRSENSFDRLFPNQDEHAGKGFGNLIALPLNQFYVSEGNCVFIDQKGNPFENQWKYLSKITKIPEGQIDKILEEAKTKSLFVPKPKEELSGKSSESLQKGHKAEELEHHFILRDEPLDKYTSASNVNLSTKLILKNAIYIPQNSLPDKLYKFLRSKLIFSNPQYYELERRGYSTWKTQRFISVFERYEDGVIAPAGFLSEIKSFAEQNNILLDIEDHQVIETATKIHSKIKLKDDQKAVIPKLLKNSRVILEANPGFGKTIVALHCIAKRAQPTLIIVHTKSLLHRWKARIKEWFDLGKDDLGIIGDNKWQIGKKITIASYQTLARKGINELKNKMGFLIIDECHHLPAKTFTSVVSLFPTKYVLGLTATALRKDKLERLMNFYIGPIIKSIKETSPNHHESETGIRTVVCTKETDFICKKISEFNEIGAEIVKNPDRNLQIIQDVCAALETGAKCLILSERIDHCQILLALLRQEIKGIHAAIAEGNMTKGQREKITKRIKQDRFQLLIATGRLIGEGFDWPEVTHLFLAFPFSWKGKLIQYIGRVQRDAPDKKEAYIYDYIDEKIPMLKRMYFKRLRTYRSMGLIKNRVISKKVPVTDDQLSLF